MTASSTHPIVDPVAEGWMGAELAQYLFGEVRHPQDNDEWLDFFEHLVVAYDKTHDPAEIERHDLRRCYDDVVRVETSDGRFYDMRRSGAAVSKKITPAIREFIREHVDLNTPSGVIRAEVQRIYGVEIKKAYMSHLRRRIGGTNL